MIKHKILKLITLTAVGIMILLSPIHIAKAENVPIITIDYAHLDSKWDNGASYNGKNEREIVNEISQMVGSQLESLGMRVKYTRDIDKPISINDRVYNTNKNGNSYYLSLHLNATEDHQGQGIESYNSGDSELTKNITYELSEELNLIHRGDFESPYYNRNIKGDTSILELGFIDSSDIHIIENSKYKISKIISNNIAQKYNYQVQQEQVYRVRKSYENVGSQLGAFKNLDNARNCIKDNPTYNIYDIDGNIIH